MSEERRQIRAAAIGLDQVISIWENMNNGCPYFAVWYNKADKFFQYNGDDLEQAKDFLITNLQVIEQTGDNSMYYLKIYPTSQTNYTRSGEICAIPFRLNAYQENNGNSVGAYSGGGNLDAFAKMLKEATEKEIALTRELMELKAVGQPVDWFERISGVLETPGAASAITPILLPVVHSIMGMLNKITGIPYQPYQPANATPHIAGPTDPENTDVDQDTKLDMQLDRLAKHGDLLEMMTVLANFADSNPPMFKMYFDGLKAQQ